jgi:hypothetical protein
VERHATENWIKARSIKWTILVRFFKIVDQNLFGVDLMDKEQNEKRKFIEWMCVSENHGYSDQAPQIDINACYIDFFWICVCRCRCVLLLHWFFLLSFFVRNIIIALCFIQNFNESIIFWNRIIILWWIDNMHLPV